MKLEFHLQVDIKMSRLISLWNTEGQVHNCLCVLWEYQCSFRRLCQQEKLPMTFQSCVITKECQVSEWSEWSLCSKTCHDMVSPKGTRVRTRVIRQFPIGSEEECPELEETEPCVSQGEAAAPCATWVNKAAASATVSAQIACLFSCLIPAEE